MIEKPKSSDCIAVATAKMKTAAFIMSNESFQKGFTWIYICLNLGSFTLLVLKVLQALVIYTCSPLQGRHLTELTSAFSALDSCHTPTHALSTKIINITKGSI